MTCQPIPLDEAAVEALDPAMRRGGNDWYQAQQWLEEGSAQIWLINGTGYVLAVANTDNEIEVLAAGGSDARGCVVPWEAHMRSDPRHKGMTLKIEGSRKGWARLLPHWECETLPDGDVTLKTRIR